MRETLAKPHWTELVYCENARLLFDVEAAIFQNNDLTRSELNMVERMAEQLRVGIQSPVMDIACGPGRHSIQLATDGFDVTGLDFSPGLLELAKESAAAGKFVGKGPTFVSGDMRELDYSGESFATVLMLGNSFGYFSDEDNLRALSEACRVLSDGGFFCLEITNKDSYLDKFEPSAEEIVEGRFHSRLKCEWNKSWDPISQRVSTREKHSIAETGEILYEGPYDVRLFDQTEIVGMLENLGLRSVICLPFTPGKESLSRGLGETFGAMEEILFVGGIK
jgi:D-alanine-D-alanine ligase